MRKLLARVTVPDDGSSCPMRMRRRVVLPIPLGPTRARRAPFATEKDTLAKRSSAPKDLERELAAIRVMVQLRNWQFVIARRIIKQVDGGGCLWSLHLIKRIFSIVRPQGRIGFDVPVDSIPIFAVANYMCSSRDSGQAPFLHCKLPAGLGVIVLLQSYRPAVMFVGFEIHYSVSSFGSICPGFSLPSSKDR